MENRRKAALGVLVGCALGALASTLYTGGNNKSWLLVGMFVVWVLAPFVALAALVGRSVALALLIALASLLVYCYAAIGPPVLHRAALYLMVPLASWVVMSTAYLACRRRRRRGTADANSGL